MDFSKQLTDKIGECMDMVPDMIAELAVDYFKDCFRNKAFDGVPWPVAKHVRSNGSLMVDTAALLTSIRAATVNAEKVVIAAGNSKVRYARAHNEGFTGSVVVRQHERTRKGNTHTVRAHTKNISIPQRQFLGDSRELERIIKDNIEQLFKSNI